MRFTEERAKIVLIALTVVGSSGLAWAQAPKTPAETIQYRQQQMKNLGGAFKAVGDQIRSGAPDLAVIRSNVPAMQKVAAELPTFFPAGSGPEAGVPTQAKPEIWTNRAGFDAKVAQFQTAVQGLATASAGSDTAAITAAAGPIGQACQGCHSEFRVRPARPPAPPAPTPTPVPTPERG